MISIWLMLFALVIFIASVTCLVTSIDKDGKVRQTRLAIAVFLFIIACGLIIVS